MKSFVRQYFLLALIGTAVVAFGAPFVRPETLPEFLRDMDRSLQSHPLVPEASARLRRWRKYLPWGEPNRQAPSPPVTDGKAPRSPWPPPPPAPEPPPPPPLDVVEMNGAITPAVSDPAPVVKRAGSAGQWAVVKCARVPVYSEAGKFLHRIDPGTLVDVSEIRQAKTGELAVCRTVNQANRVLIFTRELDLQPGALQEAEREEVQLLVDRAKAAARIQTLREEASRGVRRDNPYAAQYETAQQRYQDFWNRARELQEGRDNSSGAARMKVIDELRRMKGEDVRVGKAYETAKRNYEEWNAQHPQSTPPSTPEIRALENRLAGLNAAIERRGRAAEESDAQPDQPPDRTAPPRNRDRPE